MTTSKQSIQPLIKTTNYLIEMDNKKDMKGEYAFIGAGAVVTKEVPAYALLVGNPAKQIGWMSSYGHRLEFTNGEATCPESGEVYKLNNNKVTRIA